MSSHDDKEELIEHQYEHNIIPNGAAPAVTTVTANEAAVSVVDGEANNNTEKKNTEISRTGFRNFVLTPELLRAVIDLKFESETPVKHEWNTWRYFALTPELQRDIIDRGLDLPHWQTPVQHEYNGRAVLRRYGRRQSGRGHRQSWRGRHQSWHGHRQSWRGRHQSWHGRRQSGHEH